MFSVTTATENTTLNLNPGITSMTGPTVEVSHPWPLIHTCSRKKLHTGGIHNHHMLRFFLPSAVHQETMLVKVSVALSKDFV